MNKEYKEMKNEFWLNLASKDLAKAKEFFINLGFEINDKHQAIAMGKTEAEKFLVKPSGLGQYACI